MATYTILFRSGQTNYCPGCGKTHWVVGRVSAECAFCATAIEIKGGATQFTGRKAA